MKVIIGTLLLFTVNSAMAIGEAIQIYRQNHPQSNTTVIYTNPDDSSTSDSSNTVIYAPAGTSTSGVVVAPGNAGNTAVVPRHVDTGNNAVVAPQGTVNRFNTENINNVNNTGVRQFQNRNVNGQFEGNRNNFRNTGGHQRGRPAR